MSNLAKKVVHTKMASIRARELTENLLAIRNKVTQAQSFPVRLVAVSKTKPIEDLLIAYQAGQRHFGENVRCNWMII